MTDKAIKHDQDKVPMDLMSGIAPRELATVLGFGAQKYSSNNWRKGMAWSRLFAAAQRHLWSWWGGEDKDKETGLSHLAHAMCCIMFLLEYEYLKKENDDRYRP